MKIGFLAFAFCMALVTSSKAQLSISVNELPAGIVQKSQLWNMTMVYSGNSTEFVNIGISLFDVNDVQPVMTAFSKPITLVKGVKQLRYSEVAPVDYTYFSPLFNSNAQPDGLLPIGNYRACYTVSGSKGQVLAEECINLEVQPLSPPQLNLPADSEAVQTPYPQFSWLPPAPVTLFADLNYDFIVTEVQAGQSSQDAIQQNLPVMNAHRLTIPAYNSPGSSKKLDTGKIYAWRIIAKTGETFAAQSEVWTFKITDTSTRLPDPLKGAYLELKSGPLQTDMVVTGNKLAVRYYSYDKTHDVSVKFMDGKSQVIKEVKRRIKYGDNFLLFDLGNDFSEETIYSVELSDLQRNKYKNLFRIAK